MTSLAHDGVPGSSLISFAGCIPSEDLDEIAKAVEDGCERVDALEW